MLSHITYLLELSTDGTNITEGSVRLVGGRIPNEGLVEYFHYGHWGSVRSLNMRGATVVCRQLGYSMALALFSTEKNTEIGAGRGFIWIDSVGCTGSENNLTQCRFHFSEYFSSNRKENAGTYCAGAFANQYICAEYTLL